MSKSIMDRKRGCLLGLAIGDALGAAVEFKPPGSFPLVTEYRGGGPHGLGPGEWTDDTSMALALADSIGHAGWDLNDQANRYLVWMRAGEYSVTGTCFDIGIATRSALLRFEASRDAQTSGDTSPHSSGNGSIMRLAPVPIRYAEYFPNRIDELATRAEQSSIPTHASEICRSACRYMTLILTGFMHGLTRDIVLDAKWDALEQLKSLAPLAPEIAEIADGSFRRREPPEILGSGYVVKSLEAALWALDRSDNFRDAVLAAVNLGDDADTTGAVCGQLAGAYWGESHIPEVWQNGLAKRDMIEKALASITG
ncbi:ADP-ribosylglycohydrolase family protein [Bremerella alba]|uniref:ADP-ribosyl-[dinitrogen reductase] glycohydrolase n=1 Tax=Bremerella alba TaxID=980252 RepID=A0A7V8V6X0_9BACT|nr:ADP-ribosylglycohydrolase family protein [Bremerella alba]MBA2115809.1 ADP-ribosyl-[dinitrogen reductase] glycohydrolase [Bremerella alba]